MGGFALDFWSSFVDCFVLGLVEVQSKIFWMFV